MNFPEGEAIFVEVIAVVGIEHEPAGDADGDVGVAIFGEDTGVPVGMGFQEARGEFDDHGIFFGAADFAYKSHMSVGFGGQRKFAVGALLIAVLRFDGDEVADGAERDAFDFGDIGEVSGCPVGAKLDVSGKRQIVDDRPVDVVDVGFSRDVGAILSDKRVGIGIVAIPGAGAVGT